MSGDGYDDLVDGVREALRGAGLELDSPELWLQLRQALDEVGQAAPPHEPHLRVVQDDEEALPSPPSVRVVRMEASPRARPMEDRGRIAVSPEQWQTVFRAPGARPYRLHVLTGKLDVAVDGELVERVEAGQSLDVEGALLRVRGVEAATGVYQRL